MPKSNKENEFVSHVVELMQSVGPVTARGMFGGHGIFLNGLMFGLVADDILYLKVDDETKHEFKAKELAPFIYTKKGKEFKMSYYQAPEEALENAGEMNYWASKAFETALKATLKKRKKK